MTDKRQCLVKFQFRQRPLPFRVQFVNIIPSTCFLINLPDWQLRWQQTENTNSNWRWIPHLITRQRCINLFHPASVQRSLGWLLRSHSQATLKGPENKHLHSQNYYKHWCHIFAVTCQQVWSFLMRALRFCPCFSNWCEEGWVQLKKRQCPSKDYSEYYDN